MVSNNFFEQTLKDLAFGWMSVDPRTYLETKSLESQTANKIIHCTCLKFQLNWQQTYTKCCSLGMEPVTIYTPDEMHCLNNLTKRLIHLKYTEIDIHY
jgi:hypothetical protein